MGNKTLASYLGKGTEPLAIDPAEVTPQSLCKCGNETITVTLNTDSEKSGKNDNYLLEFKCLILFIQVLLYV